MSPDARRSVIFFGLVVLLLAAIVETPGAARTDDVGRSSRQSVTRGVRPSGGGFLPAPGEPTPPGLGGTTVPIDSRGPACTVLPEADARAVVEVERLGTVDGDARGRPLLDGSHELFHTPRAADGAIVGSQPAEAQPVDGTPYVRTAGTSASRRYAAIERYDAAAARMEPVVVFDNCLLQVAAPPLGSDAAAHLWAALRGTDGSVETIAEIDPASRQVVWQETHSRSGGLVDLGDRLLVVSPDRTSVEVVDARSHSSSGAYGLSRREILRAPAGELWVTNGDTVARLDPATGGETATFPLPDAPTTGGQRVFLAGGSVWTVEADALVQRDRDTFAETRRLPFTPDRGGVSAGADDLWLATAGSIDSNDDGTVHVDIDVRHLDARTGDERSRRHVRGTLSSASPTVDTFLPQFSVDHDGLWYEGLRTDPDGALVEGSEALFRYDGS